MLELGWLIARLFATNTLADFGVEISHTIGQSGSVHLRAGISLADTVADLHYTPRVLLAFYQLMAVWSRTRCNRA